LVFYIWTKSKVIEDLFSYISEYADFIPLILFIVFISKLKLEKSLWVIFVYCLVSILGDFFINSKPVSPGLLRYYNSFYTFFEYFSFALFIWLGIQRPPFKKVIMWVSISFFVFLAVYFVSAKYSRLDSIPIGLETLLILIFSFYFLFELTNNSKDTFIHYNFRFWVVIGMIIYLSGSFFIYLYANQLSTTEGKKFGILIDFFYILKNIFFAIAIFIFYKHPNRKLNSQSTIPHLDLDIS